MGKATEGWCILRCAGSQTLQLASSLRDAGFEAWSPVEVVQRRSRKLSKREDVDTPLTPSFVFAAFRHLGELLSLSRSPALNYRVWDSDQKRMVTKGHPHFSLFRHANEFPQVGDRELSALRQAERRSRPKDLVRVYHAGEQVHMTEGGFAGMTGTVEGSQGQFAMVRFPGWAVSIKIAAWVLEPMMEKAA